MGNEHTDYDGEVDVPVEAIQIIDPEVVKGKASASVTMIIKLTGNGVL